MFRWATCASRKSRPTHDQAEMLQVEPRHPLVQVSRVIHAENRPVAYLIDILPEDILTPDELQAGFTGSVLDLLLQRGSPALGKFDRPRSRQWLPPSEIARALADPARRCAADVHRPAVYRSPARWWIYSPVISCRVIFDSTWSGGWNQAVKYRIVSMLIKSPADDWIAV